MKIKSTHFDDEGRSRMVDVSLKEPTVRIAKACGSIVMQKKTFDMIRSKGIKKGNVLEVARLGGIMSTKKTGELIPLCHPLSISNVEIDFKFIKSKNQIDAVSKVTAIDRTGVEMEALTAVSVALLTVYDMCKSVDRGMVIKEIKLLEKSGGKSGTWKRK
ncbi:cyclic pyranopterin monophosphate synthase MoaC [Candidatus Desantisbacteria bacterium]|nr:cyclic pyranopterin monophosphate synthase MoaC [Candidatus Desantisbacteria bacterium]